MSTAVGNILRSLEEKEKYNILCICFDGFFELNLAQTGHDFHVILDPAKKSWIFDTFEIPPNVSFYKQPGNMPSYIDVDGLICNDRIRLHQQSLQLARILHVPLIYVDHHDLSAYKAEDLFLINNNKGQVHVCASNAFAQIGRFDYDSLINYGIPQQDVNQEKIYDGIIVGDYPQNQPLIHAFQNQFKIKHIHEKDHPRSMEEIERLLSQSKTYINLHAEQNIPILMLRAMSYGCIPVCSSKHVSAKILQAGYNSLITQNPQNMFNQLQQLLGVPDVLRRMSMAAANAVTVQFGVNHFINQWNGIFSKLDSMVYMG